MAPIDYPDMLDADDIETVVTAIEDNYPAHEVHIHDAETLHFGYWDTHECIVDTGLLHHIQAAGYSFIHVGHKRAPASDAWCGWKECRKYASGERDRCLTCPRCEHTFTPVTVAHRIVGAGVAYYRCPECSNHIEGSPPAPAVPDSTGGER
jgi:hypothetical protein